MQQKREEARQIENYHRRLKQECGIERCQARAGDKQKSHISLALRAFVRLKWHRYQTGISRYATKWWIIRRAVTADLDNPTYVLRAPTVQLLYY